MKLIFDVNALEDLKFWVQHDRKIALKILNLIEVSCKTPYAGVGKPEPLKHNLAGCWSRRIDREHRLVYKVKDSEMIVLACRYHY